jgi:hydroxymethylbilane synthase
MDRNSAIRIGTRESNLALWQAETVRNLLKENLQHSNLVFIKSEGDINLTTPLYELGVQGIFTKALDAALLNNEIDIAVHSYKDVPTQLAEGLVIAAVLKRDNPFDILVCRNKETIELLQKNTPLSIATSSIRRKAQWLYWYKNSHIENIRGNVNTRLQKLHSSHWHGAIFAAAGLQRLNLTEKETGPQLPLDWMLPAPSQGAIAIVCRAGDEKSMGAVAILNHIETAICTKIERNFLRLLQGGCSTPISAYAVITDNTLLLKGNITSADGSKTVSIQIENDLHQHEKMAEKAVAEMINKGGKDLLCKW